MIKYVRFAPALFALPLLASSVRIYQTNSAGDEVHVIDAATNKVVQTIKDIEVPHGVTFRRMEPAHTSPVRPRRRSGRSIQRPVN